uniref:Uncharacterized protein n=1 Tax=Chromera velia CCMP2878 TaxID=1169474 RepID=A0A0G4H3D0_9ALVE|eukprot:Cvel_5626.t1-p1 / transcript=Cvel_5626.t1 / gene=Cvel_5626 / organism=Chromera_velia_CCMP2878 / gene_product=LEC14B protein, putative / transcript_product=LEC14B protein, putative / location=Cvel_scaffold265:13581-20837(+) / protein_length=668 / sequence_SO=supercontig / SO=protein_coding / is_pseudo=false
MDAAEEGRSLSQTAPLYTDTPLSLNTERTKEELLDRFAGDSNLPSKPSSSLDFLFKRRMMGIRGETHEATKRRRREYAQLEVPNSRIAHPAIRLSHRIYGGQFSSDGNLYCCYCQDGSVRLFDTSDICEWKFVRTERAQQLHWTITDCSLSPDGQSVAYTSIGPYVWLHPTRADDHRPQRTFFISESIHPALWSVRFSADGTKFVLGASDGYCFVHDIETDKTLYAFRGHMRDVNSVELLTGSQGQYDQNVFLTGADDCTICVWDMRTISATQRVRSNAAEKPSGALLGHSDGVTCVRAKGDDGRFVCSNGKDQTLRLWDVRAMWAAGHVPARARQPRHHSFDYRWETYPGDPVQEAREGKSKFAHGGRIDCSLRTFTGHHVLKTLIRCNFSPAESTGGRFLYTGSADGAVWVWDSLSGEVVSRSFHGNPTRSSHSARGRAMVGRGGGQCPVRDVAWHPQLPVLASTGWDSKVLLWSCERKLGLSLNGEGQGISKRKNKEEEKDEIEGPRGREETSSSSSSLHHSSTTVTTQSSAELSSEDTEGLPRLLPGGITGILRRSARISGSNFLLRTLGEEGDGKVTEKKTRKKEQEKAPEDQRPLENSITMQVVQRKRASGIMLNREPAEEDLYFYDSQGRENGRQGPFRLHGPPLSSSEEEWEEEEEEDSD